jgi:chloramphenicol-sensitive protein RarD
MIKSLNEEHKGVLFAIIAHLFWGGMAIYFGFMRHIEPVEIAVNRGLWSIPIAAIVVSALGQWREVLAAFSNFRTALLLALTGAIVVFNWTFYIWCIQQGRTLDASLGYFINPLLNVVAGYIFLHERFTRPQMVALALATFAVIFETVATGNFPFIGLALGGSFCIYGLLRKTIAVGPVPGFFVETAMIAVPLLLAELWLRQNGLTHFGGNMSDTMLLIGCGALTSGALIFYALSLKRLRYSTAGLLQYLSPSLVFLIAIFVFGEHIDFWKLVGFAIIWLALAIYSVSAIREESQRVRA